MALWGFGWIKWDIVRMLWYICGMLGLSRVVCVFIGIYGILWDTFGPMRDNLGEDFPALSYWSFENMLTDLVCGREKSAFILLRGESFCRFSVFILDKKCTVLFCCII